MADRLAAIKARRYAPHAERAIHAELDLDWLVGEVERLRGLLARLEWAADRRWARAAKFCPACRADGHRGHHEPDCWLAAELRRDPDD